ncbi:hypothetical protein BC831DRAFT_17184 [Entophlyctis helioformis]|nr:hypothetical protein BC831DRAFT_17184 [Entophlyctis helioformis]
MHAKVNLTGKAVKAKRPKKLKKSDLFELRKETNRLLREREVSVPIKRSSFTLDSFLASKGIVRQGKRPALVASSSTDNPTGSSQPRTLAEIKDELVKTKPRHAPESDTQIASSNTQDDAMASSGTAAVKPKKEHLRHKPLPIIIDRHVSALADATATVSAFMSRAQSPTNPANSNPKRIATSDADDSDGDSDTLELQVVAFSNTMPVGSSASKADKASAGRLPASKGQRNRELLQLADEQIRLRRQAEAAERQRLFEEFTRKKEERRAARAAAREAAEAAAAAAAAIAAESQDADGVSGDGPDSRSMRTEAGSAGTPTDATMSLADDGHVGHKVFSEQPSQDEDLVAARRRKMHEADSMERLLLDRAASDAVAKRLGLWDDDAEEDAQDQDDGQDDRSIGNGNDDDDAKGARYELGMGSHDPYSLDSLQDSQDSVFGGMDDSPVVAHDDAPGTPLAAELGQTADDLMDALASASRPPLPPQGCSKMHLQLQPRISPSKLQAATQSTQQEQQPLSGNMSGVLELLSGSFPATPGQPSQTPDAPKATTTATPALNGKSIHTDADKVDDDILAFCRAIS